MAAKKYSAEFKDALVQEVIRDSKPIATVARENGVIEQTLRNWVGDYRQRHPTPDPELNESERAKLKRLEAENRELRQEVEFLGKATAFLQRSTRVLEVRGDSQRRRQLFHLSDVPVGQGVTVGIP